ncbi:hypothetical protein RJT34_23286 [Clitoria ternatea]|uniref:Secreted protein n=1 Tax=Clitoria ternatea TaxID=43366 RepID=A0AAN9IH19_CLITE
MLAFSLQNVVMFVLATCDRDMFRIAMEPVYCCPPQRITAPGCQITRLPASHLRCQTFSAPNADPGVTLPHSRLLRLSGSYFG